MSIDAAITKVERIGNDVRLTLAPRVERAGGWSLPGQQYLTILNATYEPHIGMELWGGAGSCELIRPFDEVNLRYRRQGYTRLVEDFEPGSQ